VGCRCWFSVPRNRYWRAGDGCVLVWVAGVGSQFLAIATGVLVMAVMGMFNVHRHGSIDIAVIILYALTSCMLRVSAVC